MRMVLFYANYQDPRDNIHSALCKIFSFVLDFPCLGRNISLNAARQYHMTLDLCFLGRTIHTRRTCLYYWKFPLLQMDCHFARPPCITLFWKGLWLGGTLRVKGFHLASASPCFMMLPFLPETSLFIPVFARVLKFVVVLDFFLNLSSNSFKHCSLSATAMEWLQIFEDEKPEKLHTSLPSACIVGPAKLATMKVFLALDAERQSVGWRHITEAVDFNVDASLHNAVILCILFWANGQFITCWTLYASWN